MSFGVHAEKSNGELVELAEGLTIRKATHLARTAKDEAPDVIIFVTFKDKGSYRRFVEVT